MHFSAKTTGIIILFFSTIMQAQNVADSLSYDASLEPLSDTQIAIDEIIVTGTITNPIRRNGDALFTGTALNRAGIKLSGSIGSTSVYHTLNLLPGISVESVDGYGLSEKTVRIRGVRSVFSGMTLEGFPNYGIMPIGARDHIYDMENMESLAIYKGATPADLGTATGSKGGAIELRYRRPSDQFEVQLQQSAGSFNYWRSFIRVDMGTSDFGAGAFLSLSRTSADKWKGPGHQGPRFNMAAGVTQELSHQLNLEFFFNHNTIDKHAYKELNYQQAIDLKYNRKLDYNDHLTGIAAEDFNFFDYNAGVYTNSDYMLIAHFDWSPATQLKFKSYLSREDAEFTETNRRGPNYFVDNRSRHINRHGLIPEIKGSFKSLNYSAGYWLEVFDNNAQVYNTRITDEGLVPVGYSSYSVNKKNGSIHSPYAKLSITSENFNLQAGIKYFHYTDPATDRYGSQSPTQLTNEPIQALHTKDMQYKAWLPSLGLGYNLNNNTQFYLNYGRNYMRPYMYAPIIGLYVNNMQQFTDNGMVLQDIFDNWVMETSDNIDLGMRYVTKKIAISPTFFYAKHYHVLASAYDARVQLNYLQNVGKLTAYGVEAEIYVYPYKGLTFMVNPTFTSMSYDEHLIRGDQVVKIKGNQSPATPEFSLKSAFFGTWNSFGFNLMTRHTGQRYGDATNLEPVDAYTLLDAGINYTFADLPFIKNLELGMTVNNIFDTVYIGAINNSDDSQQGSADYFPGAPRVFSASLNLTF
jgi:iron complex outermembrane recepter protein